MDNVRLTYHWEIMIIQKVLLPSFKIFWWNVCYIKCIHSECYNQSQSVHTGHAKSNVKLYLLDHNLGKWMKFSAILYPQSYKRYQFNYKDKTIYKITQSTKYEDGFYYSIFSPEVYRHTLNKYSMLNDILFIKYKPI